MSHELFLIDRKPQPDEKDADRVAYLYEQLSIAESLGLKAQVKVLEMDIATARGHRLITTPPMTDSELTIWRAWLPTVYSDIGNLQHRALSNYRFDRIPGPVLKLWQKHKESGLFDRFEIWTPENQQPDPILVGVAGTLRYLLARWGESDANLVSFDDIKCELVCRWHANEEIGHESYVDRVNRIDRTVNAFLASSVFSAIAGALSAMVGIPLLLAFVLFGAVCIFIYVRRWMTKKAWQSSALMQAIVKDNSPKREMLPAAA